METRVRAISEGSGLLTVAEALQNAMGFHQAGDLENAEHGYRAILGTQPDCIDALHYLGLLEAQRGHYAEALSLFDRALEIDSESVDVLANRGNVLSALGRPRDALASYERVLAIDPDSALAHFNLGNIFRELSRYEDALASYDKALASMPENVVVLFNRGDVLQRLTRYDEGLASYDRCLALAPEFAAAMYNRAVILQKLGKHEDALASYEQALDLQPNDADALNNRGKALFDLRRFEEALASYERALTIRPDFAEALSSRGNTLRELKRPEEAVASFNQALSIKPDFAEAHNNLGHVLKNLGRADEAIASFQRALALESEFAEAHNNLGNVLREQGRLAEAVASYRRAVELMPTSVDANTNLSVALHHLVPAWHVPMMNDVLRNEAYVKALTAAVTEQTNVLEIGTGSGLLAMIAARLGARQVVTCEGVPLIAATARDIVAANGRSSSVSIISKMSRDLVVGVDLPQRANLLVSEILSSELLGEGVLDSIEDAKRRLLDPNAKIIPAAGSVVFALFGGEAIKKNMMVDDVLGFDLSGFNAIASRKRYIHRHDLDVGLLTDTAEAFVFDFVGCDHFPAERKTLRLPITAAGVCYGVAQWIRLRLDDNFMFENHPSVKTPASSWQTCFYRFPVPIRVRPGQTARVCAAHNRLAVWFFWEGLEE
jgi:tetratricopeptide (TPR) repeat protein